MAWCGGEDQAPMIAVVFFSMDEGICAGGIGESKGGEQGKSGGFKQEKNEECSTTIVSSEGELKKLG